MLVTSKQNVGSLMKRRVIPAALFAAAMAVALGYPATAAAEPACPKNTVTIGNQGEVINLPGDSQVCDDDVVGSDGLLSNLPLLGSLPGVSGVL
jgi:hypothetical protein